MNTDSPTARGDRWRRLAGGATALALLAGALPAALAHGKHADTSETQGLALQTQAAQALRVPGLPLSGVHLSRQGVHPSQLPLRSPEDLLPRRERIGDAPQPALSHERLGKRALAARAQAEPLAGTSCQAADFQGKRGAELLAFIDNAALGGCMYQLYYGRAGDFRTVFNDANIISVANEIKARAQRYTGTESDRIKNLISFLRTAGYWWYMSEAGNTAEGIAPGSRSMMNAVLNAFRQLVAAPRFYDVNEANAYVVSEVFKTVPAGFASTLAPAAKRWIEQFQPSHADAGYWTHGALLESMNVLFRGDTQTAFNNLVRNDLSYARALDGFVTRNLALLQGDGSYHLRNAMGEMLRFLRHPALKDSVRLMGVRQMTQFAPSDDAAIDIWLRAADMVDAFDQPHCAAYGTCDAAATLARTKLPITHACNAHYTIRAQAMTPAQLQASCQSVINQTDFFHGLFGSAGRPLPNDNNQTLELVVFDSSAQYQRFSGHLFGNSTDNGGMYLEGQPWVPGNQARFIAYRAEWLSGFEIWNLNHEFNHYLDGRFNMAGGFGDYPLENQGSNRSAVWWIEGMAEYVAWAYQRRYNAEATSRAQTAPLALSEVLRNTYSSGSPRVYNWGYLASRYLIERQPQVDAAFLPLMRAGNYAGYSQQIQGLGTQLDADFSRWLQQCVSGGDTQSVACVSQRAGTLPLLTASAVGDCRQANFSELGNGCARQLGSAGSASHFYIRASGWERVLFRLSELQGSADVYAKAGGWASAGNHDAHGVASPGAPMTLNLPTQGQGYVYVSVVPRADFGAATLRGMYSELPFDAPLAPSRLGAFLR